MRSDFFFRRRFSFQASIQSGPIFQRFQSFRFIALFSNRANVSLSARALGCNNFFFNHFSKKECFWIAPLNPLKTWFFFISSFRVGHRFRNDVIRPKKLLLVHVWPSARESVNQFDFSLVFASVRVSVAFDSLGGQSGTSCRFVGFRHCA